MHNSIIRTIITAENTENKWNNKKNLTELLAAFRVAKDRSLIRNIYGFQRYATIVSYCPKGNKVVVLLYTMHNNKGVESSGELKLKKKSVL